MIAKRMKEIGLHEANYHLPVNYPVDSKMSQLHSNNHRRIDVCKLFSVGTLVTMKVAKITFPIAFEIEEIKTPTNCKVDCSRPPSGFFANYFIMFDGAYFKILIFCIELVDISGMCNRFMMCWSKLFVDVSKQTDTLLQVDTAFDVSSAGFPCDSAGAYNPLSAHNDSLSFRQQSKSHANIEGKQVRTY